MAFNPLYAIQRTMEYRTGLDGQEDPGRPVNLRRDIGVTLGQLPILTPENAMGGLPQESSVPTSSTRDRATAAATSIGNAIDPNTPSAFGQFAGGLARGFAGVQSYLQAVTGQRETRQEHREDRDLSRRRTEAQITTEGAQADYYKAGAEERRRPEPTKAAPTPAADRWVEDRNVPVGQPRLQRNTRTGATKPILDPSGRPMRVEARPTAPRGNRTSQSPTSTPAKTLSTEDYNLLKADGMTDQEMRDAGYTLP